MSAFLTGALAGTTVEIETALTPPVRVNVGEQLKDDGTGPGFLVRLLRPRVRLVSGSSEVFRIEPAGSPDPELRAMLVTGLLLVALVFVLALSKR